MTDLSEPEIRQVVVRVLNGIAPEIDVGSIDPGRDLRDQMDIDSVDFLNFIVGLHNQLGIEIPDADISKLATINSCIAYLGARIRDRKNGPESAGFPD